MTIGDISTKITSLTGATTADYTTAERLIDINIAQHDISIGILNADTGIDFDDARYGDFPILASPLTVNRDLTIPVSEKVLKIKRVDITYDNSNWYKAEPIDRSAMGIAMGDADDEDSYFSTSAPRYDWNSNSLLIYPRATAEQVATGAQIKIQWQRQIKEMTSADLTTGTEVPGFDDPFHYLIALICSYEFCKSRVGLEGKTDRFKMEIRERWAEMLRFYSSKNPDQHMSLIAAQVNYE